MFPGMNAFDLNRCIRRSIRADAVRVHPPFNQDCPLGTPGKARCMAPKTKDPEPVWLGIFLAKAGKESD